MRSVHLDVYGIPAPQGSKTIGAHGGLYESSKKVAPWRKAVAEAVALLGDVEQFTTPVVIAVRFYLPRPRSVKRLYPSVPPDLDKLQRSLGDGLSIDSTILADDSLIIRWEAEKFYADNRPAGAEVTITEVDSVPLVVGS
jgi:crossover junction endodeoxyribonuclease RusA